MSLLDTHFLTYTPIVDQQREVMATRISVHGDGTTKADPANVYAAMISTCRDCPEPILLTTAFDQVSDKLTITDPADNLWLEIPAPLLATAEGTEWTSELISQGFRLVLGGMPHTPLPENIAGQFELAIISADEDRRSADKAPATDKRQLKTAIGQVTTISQMEQAFAAGATAIVGWPLDDAQDRDAPSSSNNSFTSVSRLLSLINSGAEPEEMEKILATDPTLAFRLFRYLNSPAFGLSVEIRSFEHALMMLGQKRMKKWLSLLLATASPEPNLNPLMYASVRRGFMLEKLVSEFHEQQAQDEAFILGIFSMLDKLFCEPFEQLFDRLQIPETVQEALVSNSGPSMPYLRLAQAIESNPAGVAAAQEEAFVSTKSCNQMLMATLNEAAMAQRAA